MTYFELLKEIQEKAINNKKEKEAIEFLLLERLKITKAEFLLKHNEKVDKKFLKNFIKEADQYIYENKPIQHLLGYSYFYNRKFKVNKNTLIPRPESEQLIFHILKFYKEQFTEDNIDVLDLATGSGCIGITLKKEIKSANVTISDISKKALKVAKENVKDHNVEIEVIESNWFENINDKFDIIVSNPPYIALNEEIDEIVKKDPYLALFAGESGLEFYDIILKNIKPHLKKNSLIAFEHGYKHHKGLKKLIHEHLDDVEVIQLNDFNDHERFTFIKIGDNIKWSNQK